LRRKLKFIYKRKKRKTKSRFMLSFQCRYILTKKPAEIRMGKVKGAIDNYVYRIKVGKVLFEAFGLSFFILKRIFNKVKQKLPVQTFLIKKLINV
jgi:large subunit ribosomal protein L16